MISGSLHTRISSGTGLAGYLAFLSLIQVLNVFKVHLVLLVVFSGTSPLGKVESSSSVANLNHVDSGWTEREEWLAVCGAGD
jgi:hypothetical protein